MSKYLRLADLLQDLERDEVLLSFRDIEQALGEPLSASAQRYSAFWSAGNHAGRVLAAHGWRAALRAAERGVRFTRTGFAAGRATGRRMSHPAPVGLPNPDLILVGCVKSKRRGRHPARELYDSPLFAGRRTRAERAGVPWYILSAEHHLLAPDTVTESYERSLGGLRATERREWSRRVLEELQAAHGDLRGKRIEIHAGSEYRESGLERGLRACGANVVVPLAGMSLGQQLQWYGRMRTEAQVAAPADPSSRGSVLDPPGGAANGAPASAPSLSRAREIASLVTRDFCDKRLELERRPGAPVPGWEGMPELRAAAALRAAGRSGTEIRVFLTLVAALDRARDADRLWDRAVALERTHPWTFDLREGPARPLLDLREALASSGVSQRHGADTLTWRLILEALANPASPAPVRGAVLEGRGEVVELLRAARERTKSGQPWFPMLAGPKVSVMWVRMLSLPGGADIAGLDTLPVAVDVQVRKVTENLGVADTAGQPLEKVRESIQHAWRSAAPAAHGPEPLAGTGAALDPALWFFAKWGCTFCERAGERIPIGEACRWCRLSVED